MYDAGKILTGLVVFLLLATAPVWLDALSGVRAEAPQLTVGKNAAACVLPAGEMRASHMALLDRWRDEAVRQGQRTAVGFDGRRYRKSLTGTCLGCHTDKASFCDRCHEFAAVTPYCWDCHVVPEGGAS